MHLVRGKEFNPNSLRRTPRWLIDISEAQKNLSEKILDICISNERCPVCRDQKFDDIVVVHGYRYVICSDCRHIFSIQYPDQQVLKKMYDNEKDFGNSQASIYVDDELYEFRKQNISTPKYNFFKDTLNSHGRVLPDQWIDIGCSTGELLSVASSEIDDCVGFDFDNHACEFARTKGVNAIVAEDFNFNYCDFYSGETVVSCINVLEHIPSPIEFLKQIVGRPPKYLLFEVPKHPSISTLIRFLSPKLAYRHIYPPDHLHIFSEDSIRKMVDSIGYEILGKWYFGQDSSDFINTAFASALPGYGPLLHEYMQCAGDIQRSIDGSDLSDSIIVVCEFKK